MARKCRETFEPTAEADDDKEKEVDADNADVADDDEQKEHCSSLSCFTRNFSMHNLHTE